MMLLYQRASQPFWAMGSQIVTSGANFLTTIIIVRSLGIEEFGQLSMYFLMMMITRYFLLDTMLLPMSTIGPKLSCHSLKAYRGFLLANGLIFATCSSLLLALLFVPLGYLLNTPWLSAFWLPFVLANFTAIMADFVRRYHFVYERPILAFFVDLIRFSIQIGLLLLMAWKLPDHFSSQSALYILAIAAIIAALFGALTYGSINWCVRFNRAIFPRHWNFIKWMTPSVALEVLQGPGIMLIAGGLFGEAILGGVRAMQSLANTINLPMNALQQIAPSLAAREYKKSIQKLRRFLTRLALISLSIVFTITLLVAINANLLINELFNLPGEDYFWLLMLFCLLNIILAIRFPLQTYLQTLEKPGYILAASFLGAIVSISALFMLVQFGETAVPLSRNIAYLASLIVFVFGLSRINNATKE